MLVQIICKDDFTMDDWTGVLTFVSGAIILEYAATQMYSHLDKALEIVGTPRETPSWESSEEHGNDTLS